MTTRRVLVIQIDGDDADTVRSYSEAVINIATRTPVAVEITVLGNTEVDLESLVYQDEEAEGETYTFRVEPFDERNN